MRATLGVALLSVAVAACLPRGDPPAGRQIVADRLTSLTGVLPSAGDGISRILATRHTSSPDREDLVMIAVDRAGGPATETLLSPDLDPSNGLSCAYGVAPCWAVDAAGGIWVTPRGPYSPTRIDPVTGDRMDFPNSQPLWSPGRTRFYITDNWMTGPVNLYDLNHLASGPITVSGGWPAFYGEDFYYLTSQGELMRIPDSSVPEQVAAGILPSPAGSDIFFVPFSGYPTADGMAWVFNRLAAGATTPQTSIRDPRTGVEAVLPFGPNVQVSADGRWLLDMQSSGSGQLRFYDYRAGVMSIVDVPPDVFVSSGITWQPGGSRLWLQTPFIDGTSDVVILDPTTPATVTRVPDRIMVYMTVTNQPSSFGAGPFTADGAYWFSAVPGEIGAKSGIEVGPAGDPNKVLLAMDAAPQVVDPLWSLAGDRFLAGIYTKPDDRQTRADAVLFDLRTGDSRVLSERGRVATVGQTRLAGMFHFDGQRGDLTVVDIDGGQQTVLAPEFAVTAFAEQRGADALAPGAPIVYQFQARTESPYDGIWLTSCP